MNENLQEKPPVKIAITGAAGNINYSLLFRIASGEMLGFDQPVILQLLEIPAVIHVLKSVRMELEDCAYPMLRGILVTDKMEEAFDDADYALLIGSRPRSKGMARNDLLSINGEIFKSQGEAINRVAKRSVRILVIGNPANTNALIAMTNAPDINPRQFTAMTRLDHNRIISQVSAKLNVAAARVYRATIWGNHSDTMYPDISLCMVNGKSALEQLGSDWCRNILIPLVQNRGAEIMQARGTSSAASAASAIIDDIKVCHFGTRHNDWTSMAVASTGQYNIPEGLFFSFPLTINACEYQVVENLEINDFSQQMLDKTQQELVKERDVVRALL